MHLAMERDDGWKALRAESWVEGKGDAGETAIDQ